MRWAWVLLGAFAAALLAAVLVPFIACPDCDGFVAQLLALGDFPEEAESIYLGCPRCDDRGRITAANRLFRRPMDPLLRELIEVHAIFHPGTARIVAFRDLLPRLTPEDLFRWSGSLRPITDFSVAFVREEARPYLALVVASTQFDPEAKGDRSITWFFLMDLQGRILDEAVLSSVGADRMDCFSLFRSPPWPDGAVLAAQERFPDGVPYRVHYGNQTTVNSEGQRSGDPTRSLLRLGIQGGKWRLIEPPQAASP